MSTRPLSRLSDHSLVSSLEQLVRRERARVVEILDHLDEVDRRRLYREMGYSSLFAYCVGALKFSESVAGRRVATMRALRRAPGARAMLESGEASVTTVALVAGLLTNENGAGLLARIKGKSQREVEAIVAAYRPGRARRDRVRVVCVPTAPPPGVVGGAACGTEAGPPSMQATSGAGSESAAAGDGVGTPRDGGVEAAGRGGAAQTECSGAANETCNMATSLPPTWLVRKHEIRFVVGDAFMRALEECRGLVATPQNLNPTLEEVFAAAMDVYLEKNSPARRARRRGKKQRAREENVRELGKVDAGGADAPGGDSEAMPATHRADADSRSAPVREPLPARGVNRSRHIPVATRDAVWVRDGGRCTWVGSSGRRCGATRGLEIDHVHPFAQGGGHRSDNLRLLCHAHNALAAERAYGHDAVARYARREK